jgi:hypothetical protein
MCDHPDSEIGWDVHYRFRFLYMVINLSPIWGLARPTAELDFLIKNMSQAPTGRHHLHSASHYAGYDDEMKALKGRYPSNI